MSLKINTNTLGALFSFQLKSLQSIKNIAQGNTSAKNILDLFG